MDPVQRGFRSLFAQSLLWIVLPLSLLMLGVVLMGLLAFQRTLSALLVDRDRQLAVLSARRVSQDLDIYADYLEDMAAEMGSPEWIAGDPPWQDLPAEVMEVFNAGIVVADENGLVLERIPRSVAPVGSHVGLKPYFRGVKRSMGPVFSGVVSDARTGEDMVVIAVPIRDDADQFWGALIGTIHLHTAPLADPLRRLVVGDEGFAYMVDSEGRGIYHPDPGLIGTNFSARPFIPSLLEGDRGGQLWREDSGQRLVLGYAPIEGKGWGLVIREPWEDVVSPAQGYVLLVVATALLATALMAVILYRGTRRITEPVRSLAAQSMRLAMGEKVELVPKAGIRELDALALSFNHMAGQIASYRAGLRRYLGSITRSQEQERLRISHELHDETAQNLLAISRSLEMQMAEEGGSGRLESIKSLVDETLSGVRSISRDLRPLALDDLGLVPALRALAEGVADLEGDPQPEVHLKIQGSLAALSSEQELVLYRISQEGLNNARRHSRAENVWITLTCEPQSVELHMQDDGKGFEIPESLAELAQRGSYGLLGIQERAWAIGGRTEIRSSPGGGTSMRITLPVNGGPAFRPGRR